MSSASRIGSYSGPSSALARTSARTVRDTMSAAMINGEGSQPITAS